MFSVWQVNISHTMGIGPGWNTKVVLEVKGSRQMSPKFSCHWGSPQHVSSVHTRLCQFLISDFLFFCVDTCTAHWLTHIEMEEKQYLGCVDLLDDARARRYDSAICCSKMSILDILLSKMKILLQQITESYLLAHASLSKLTKPGCRCHWSADVWSYTSYWIHSSQCGPRAHSKCVLVAKA